MAHAWERPEAAAEMFPATEPYDSGLLDVGDGHEVYWECCGNRDGRPLVYLHGGPGSGATLGQRRFFDPALSRRPVRPARERAQPTAGQRARRRSEREHDRPPRRRHRAAARAPRSREVDSLRAVVGNDPRPGLRAGASSTGRRAGARPVTTTSRREVAWLARRGAHLPGSGNGSPPRSPRCCGTSRSWTPTPSCCSTRIPPYATTPPASGAPGRTHTSRSPRAIAATRASTTTPSTASGSHGSSRTTGGTPLSSRRIS